MKLLSEDVVTGSLKYTSSDFATLRKDMMALIPQLTPEWTNANDTDMGITLMNVFCGVGDMLSYYLNEQVNELYLPTARLRQSVINLTKLIGYRLARPTSATVDITLTFPSALTEVLTIPAYTVFTTADDGIPFVVAEDAVAPIGATTLDVSLVQGEPKTEKFTSTGADEQRYSLSSTKISENMLTVLVGSQAREYIELQKDVYLANQTIRRYFYADTDSFDNTVLVMSSAYGDLPKSLEQVTVTYLETLGSAGMVAGNMITQTRESGILPDNTVIAQPNPAKNGADREKIAFTKVQAPREIRTLWRAVTLTDYKTLLDGYPGVVKSAVFDITKDSSIPIHQVKCVVAPTGGGALTQTFKDSLTTFLERVRMSTVAVELLDPTYVTVHIQAGIYVRSGYNQTTVLANVTTALQEAFAFGNYDFGETVRFSQIVSIIQGVAGVAYVAMTSPTADVSISASQIMVLDTPEITVSGVV